MLTVDYDRLDLRAGERVLDLGAGAGRHAFEAYRRGARVVAVDLAREELGDVTADELPIKGFDSLATADAAKAAKELRSPHDIRVIIRYEETHKNRSSVISAAQVALAAVAKEVVGVDS